MRHIVVSLFCAFLSITGVCAATQQTPNQRLESAVRTKNVNGIWDAIYDGATNIDAVLMRAKSTVMDAKVLTALIENASANAINELLHATVSNEKYANISMIQILVDVGGAQIAPAQMDALYITMIRSVCKDGAPAEYVAELNKVAPWNYEIGRQTLYYIAGIPATYDSVPNVAHCVFSVVANNKLAGAEFIDMVMNIALEHNAHNTLEYITQLRTAMTTLQSQQ